MGGAALPVRRRVPRIPKLGLKTYFIIMTCILYNEMRTGETVYAALDKLLILDVAHVVECAKYLLYDFFTFLHTHNDSKRVINVLTKFFKVLGQL